MEQRKYRVEGVTEDGDVWAFETDDKGRADEVLSDMIEDLDDARLSEPGVTKAVTI